MVITLKRSPANSLELADQDYELAKVQLVAVMDGYDATDPVAVARFRAAMDRREAAMQNLLAAMGGS